MTQPAVPFLPTKLPNGNPTTCYCCGRHAIGIGFGDFRSDPKYLCELCMPYVEHIKAIRKFDTFEVKAVEAAVEAVGDFLETTGTTDLGEFTEQQAYDLAKTIVVAFGDGLRAAVKSEVPF